LELSTAIQLVKHGVDQNSAPQHWVDLGAGNGLFTEALASLLPPGSSIKAIDKNDHALQSTEWKSAEVNIQMTKLDFTKDDWGNGFNGILIANALHYVRDQLSFLKVLKTKLTLSGRIILVEYEMRQPNPWVPYPIDLRKLKKETQDAGFDTVSKLQEVPSRFGSGTMYSALIKSSTS
jgi:trans-aconitate methyltransferase